jgi:hypothetical protein
MPAGPQNRPSRLRLPRGIRPPPGRLIPAPVTPEQPGSGPHEAPDASLASTRWASFRPDPGRTRKRPLPDCVQQEHLFGASCHDRVRSRPLALTRNAAPQRTCHFAAQGTTPHVPVRPRSRVVVSNSPHAHPYRSRCVTAGDGACSFHADDVTGSRRQYTRRAWYELLANAATASKSVDANREGDPRDTERNPIVLRWIDRDADAAVG